MRRIFLLLALIPACAFAQSVPQSYFGMDINTTGTAWPNITQAPTPTAPFGVLRLHDDGADMADIFGTATTSTCDPITTHVFTTCNWTSFDHWISSAGTHSQLVMYTFHKTPNFAGSFTSSPPSDTALKGMVDAIRNRAGCTATVTTGCIRYWEVWNEPNNDGGTLSTTSSGAPYWSGSIENLVHVARIIHDEVHTVANGGLSGVDPSAMVVGPGVADFGSYTNMPGGNISTSGVCAHWTNLPEPEAFICEYLRRTGSGSGDLAGKSYTDAVTSHLYPNVVAISSMAEDPITVRGGAIITAMGDNSVTLCAHGVRGKAGTCANYFATEDSWGAQSSGLYPNIGPVSPSVQVSGSGQTGSWRDDQSAFLIKAYQIAWSEGLEMYVWYGWDFQNGWGNLWCATSGSDTPTKQAARGCLIDGTHASFPWQQDAAKSFGVVQAWMMGHTLSGTCTKDGNATWTCNYTGPWGYTAQSLWNSPRTGVLLTPSGGFSQQRDIYGVITSFSGTITPGYYPVLLEHLSSARHYAGGWN